MNSRISLLSIFIFILVILSGCGSPIEGKIYFTSDRFPMTGNDGSTRAGTSVYQRGRVKDLYHYISNPAVTKDGELLVGFDVSKKSTMVIINLKDGTRKNIVLPYRPLHFSWFPDKRRIALSRPESFDLRKQVYNIYIYDLETGKEEKITNHIGKEIRNLKRLNVYDLSVSPDGKNIVYASDKVSPYDESGRSIRILNLKSGEIKVLPFSGGNVKWSPKGDIIALSGIYRTEEKVEHGASIIIYDVHTRKFRKIKQEGEFQWFEDLSFFPSGEKLAYVRIENDGRYTLWTMNIDGSNKKQVIDGRYHISNINWTE